MNILIPSIVGITACQYRTVGSKCHHKKPEDMCRNKTFGLVSSKAFLSLILKRALIFLSTLKNDSFKIFRKTKPL